MEVCISCDYYFSWKHEVYETVLPVFQNPTEWGRPCFRKKHWPPHRAPCKWQRCDTNEDHATLQTISKHSTNPSTITKTHQNLNILTRNIHKTILAYIASAFGCSWFFLGKKLGQCGPSASALPNGRSSPSRLAPKLLWVSLCRLPCSWTEDNQQRPSLVEAIPKP